LKLTGRTHSFYSRFGQPDQPTESCFSVSSKDSRLWLRFREICFDRGFPRPAPRRGRWREPPVRKRGPTAAPAASKTFVVSIGFFASRPLSAVPGVAGGAGPPGGRSEHDRGPTPLGEPVFGKSWPPAARGNGVAGDRKLDGAHPPLDAGRDEAARTQRPPPPDGPVRGRCARRRQKKAATGWSPLEAHWEDTLSL